MQRNHTSSSNPNPANIRRIPDEYLCPISLEIMRDPVMTEVGISYERVEIEQWLAVHNTDPSTGSVLNNIQVIPNVQLRQAIESFQAGNTSQPIFDHGLISLHTNPDGNCAFHAALGEFNYGWFEYPSHVSARRVVANIVRLAAGLPCDASASPVAGMLNQTIILQRQAILLTYARRDIASYIAEKNPMGSQNPDVLALINAYQENADNVDFDHIQNSVIEVYVRYISQPGIWLNDVTFGLIAICFNLSINLYRTNEYRDSEFTNLDERGQDKFTLVERFNEGEGRPVVSVRHTGHDHYERLLSSREALPILQRVADEKRKVPEASKTNGIDLSNVPDKLKCKHCNDLLQMPIVKHHSQKNRYFHQECFGEFSKIHLPSGELPEAISEEIYDLLSDLANDHGLNIEGNIVENQEADALFKLAGQIGTWMSKNIDNKKFSPAEYKEIFTEIGRYQTVIGRDFKRHLVRVLPSQIETIQGKSLQAFRKQIIPWKGQFGGTVGVGTVTGLGTIVLETGFYFEAGYAVTFSEMLGSWTLAARIAIPAVAIVTIFYGIMLYFGSEQAKLFGDKLQEALDLLSGAKEPLLNAEDRFQRIETLLESVIGKKHKLFSKTTVNRSTRRTILSPETYALAHFIRGYNVLQHEGGDIELAYEELKLAYDDAASNFKPICAMALAEIWSGIDSAKALPSKVRSGETFAKAAAKQGAVENADEHVRQEEFSYWLQECSSSPQLGKACSDRVKDYYAVLLNILKDPHPPKREEQENIQCLIRFNQYYLFEHIEPKGFWDILVTFLQGIAWLTAKLYELEINYKKEIIKTKERLAGYAGDKFEECCQKMLRYKYDINNIHTITLDEEPRLLIKVMQSFMYSSLDRLFDAGLFPANTSGHAQSNKEKLLRDLGLLLKLQDNVAGGPCLEDILHKSQQVHFMENGTLSLERVLGEILVAESFARMNFNGGANWLHYLVQFSQQPDFGFLHSRIKEVIRHIIRLEVSPYQRDEAHRTAISYITSRDPHGLIGIMRPTGLKTDFIGVEAQITRVQTAITAITKNPLEASHFLLLSGPPGVGKTEIIKALFVQSGFVFKEFKAAAPEDMWRGQLLNRVQEFFSSENGNERPICLFLDEIDNLCSNITNSDDDLGRQIVRLIQTEIDKLKPRRAILVGATNHIDRLDAAIISRAGAPIEFMLPNCTARQKFFEDRFRNAVMSPLWITRLSEASCGWSHRNMVDFVRNIDANVSEENFLRRFQEMRSNVMQAFKAKYGVQLETPKLKLSPHANITSMVYSEETQKTLNQMIDFVRQPQKYLARLGQGQMNLLLYGPPGTGKTTVAKIIAEETNVAFISVNSGEIQLDPKLLIAKLSARSVFEKCIVFIDEIDVIGNERSPLREILQTQIDGINSGSSNNICIIVAATNYAELLAAPMQDRFSSRLRVNLPDSRDRHRVITNYLSHMMRNGILFSPHLRDNFTQSCDNFSHSTEGFSYRKLKNLFDDLIRKITFEENQGSSNAELTEERITTAIDTFGLSYSGEMDAEQIAAASLMRQLGIHRHSDENATLRRRTNKSDEKASLK